MSTRASENTCWFPNRLLGHYNRSSFIRRERLGSISSLGSLRLPFRGMWMIVTRSSQKKRVPVGPCVTRACPTSPLAYAYSSTNVRRSLEILSNVYSRKIISAGLEIDARRNERIFEINAHTIQKVDWEGNIFKPEKVVSKYLIGRN